MFIRCVCGQKYNVKDSLAGLQVRCRKCGEHILVQSADQPAVVTPVHPQTAAVPVYDPNLGQPGHPVTQPPPADTMSLGNISDNQMDMGPPPGAGHAFAARSVPGRRPKTIRVKIDYSPVNKGIRLIYAGTLVSILCGIAAAIAIATGILAIAVLLILGVFVGVVLAMVGYVFCIWVPARTEARPLIIAATSCNGLHIVVSLMKTLVSAADAGAKSPILDFLSIGLGAATMILFLLFIKKVAEYVENYEAGHDAWSLLIFYIAVACIAFGFVLSIFLVGPFLGKQALVIYVLVGMLSMLIVAVIWMVYFLNFINSLDFKRTPRRH